MEICIYCGKECKNLHSRRCHEIRCHDNPDRVIQIPWNSGLTSEDPRVKKNSENRNSTMLERYGSLANPNPEKSKETCLKKYGCEHPSQCPEIIKKANKTRVKTVFEKYGVEYVSQVPGFKEKGRQTWLDNHPGYNSPAQLPGVADKISEKLSDPETLNRITQTCLQKYHAKRFSASEEGIANIKATKFLNHGDENYNNKDKEYSTRKENGTLGLFETKPEKELKEVYIQQYGEENVETQYRTEEYPFKADFYIKSIDTYIEYNGYPTHKDHLFDPTNPEDALEKQRLEALLDSNDPKQVKYARQTLYQWTDLDERKWQTSINNNLNLVFIYPNYKGEDIVYSHMKV